MTAGYLKKLPLWATLFRIAAVPFIVLIMLLQAPYWNWISAALFILASISDWLDGYWARKYKAESDLGRLLDPIADKVLVSTVLVFLIPLGRIEALLVVLLLNRDILINGLRSFAASKGKIISAGSLGKWKTGFQMVAIPALLIHENIGPLPTQFIGYWGLWISLILSLLSGAEYVYGYFKK
ncbi:MAG: CDP-diacylglycerol--glycerol-3-phosphate 3-phosphatidyltransferase [Bdellovibrionaceae bacterium]|nr:CDP-diacylglycerol--glycerol-3-phosphate 3-phosphatidyltransferase [Pseudobdellovibrionaceae bacterium]